jgi:hypothetical protein
MVKKTKEEEEKEKREYAIPVETPMGEQLKWVTEEEATKEVEPDIEKEIVAPELVKPEPAKAEELPPVEPGVALTPPVSEAPKPSEIEPVLEKEISPREAPRYFTMGEPVRAPAEEVQPELEPETYVDEHGRVRPKQFMWGPYEVRTKRFEKDSDFYKWLVTEVDPIRDKVYIREKYADEYYDEEGIRYPCEYIGYTRKDWIKINSLAEEAGIEVPDEVREELTPIDISEVSEHEEIPPKEMPGKSITEKAHEIAVKAHETVESEKARIAENPLPDVDFTNFWEKDYGDVKSKLSEEMGRTHDAAAELAKIPTGPKMIGNMALIMSQNRSRKEEVKPLKDREDKACAQINFIDSLEGFTSIIPTLLAIGKVETVDDYLKTVDDFEGKITPEIKGQMEIFLNNLKKDLRYVPTFEEQRITHALAESDKYRDPENFVQLLAISKDHPDWNSTKLLAISDEDLESSMRNVAPLVVEDFDRFVEDGVREIIWDVACEKGLAEKYGFDEDTPLPILLDTVSWEASEDEWNNIVFPIRNALLAIDPEKNAWVYNLANRPPPREVPVEGPPPAVIEGLPRGYYERSVQGQPMWISVMGKPPSDGSYVAEFTTEEIEEFITSEYVKWASLPEEQIAITPPPVFPGTSFKETLGILCDYSRDAWIEQREQRNEMLKSGYSTPGLPEVFMTGNPLAIMLPGFELYDEKILDPLAAQTASIFQWFYPGEQAFERKVNEYVATGRMNKTAAQIKVLRENPELIGGPWARIGIKVGADPLNLAAFAAPGISALSKLGPYAAKSAYRLEKLRRFLPAEASKIMQAPFTSTKLMSPADIVDLGVNTTENLVRAASMQEYGKVWGSVTTKELKEMLTKAAKNAIEKHPVERMADPSPLGQLGNKMIQLTPVNETELKTLAESMKLEGLPTGVPVKELREQVDLLCEFYMNEGIPLELAGKQLTELVGAPMTEKNFTIAEGFIAGKKTHAERDILEAALEGRTTEEITNKMNKETLKIFEAQVKAPDSNLFQAGVLHTRAAELFDVAYREVMTKRVVPYVYSPVGRGDLATLPYGGYNFAENVAKPALQGIRPSLASIDDIQRAFGDIPFEEIPIWKEARGGADAVRQIDAMRGITIIPGKTPEVVINTLKGINPTVAKVLENSVGKRVAENFVNVDGLRTFMSGTSSNLKRGFMVKDFMRNLDLAGYADDTLRPVLLGQDEILTTIPKVGDKGFQKMLKDKMKPILRSGNEKEINAFIDDVVTHNYNQEDIFKFMDGFRLPGTTKGILEEGAMNGDLFLHPSEWNKVAKDAVIQEIRINSSTTEPAKAIADIIGGREYTTGEQLMGDILAFDHEIPVFEGIPHTIADRAAIQAGEQLERGTPESMKSIRQIYSDSRKDIRLAEEDLTRVYDDIIETFNENMHLLTPEQQVAAHNILDHIHSGRNLKAEYRMKNDAILEETWAKHGGYPTQKELEEMRNKQKLLWDQYNKESASIAVERHPYVENLIELGVGRTTKRTAIDASERALLPRDVIRMEGGTDTNMLYQAMLYDKAMRDKSYFTEYVVKSAELSGSKGVTPEKAAALYDDVITKMGMDPKLDPLIQSYDQAIDAITYEAGKLGITSKLSPENIETLRNWGAKATSDAGKLLTDPEIEKAYYMLRQGEALRTFKTTNQVFADYTHANMFINAALGYTPFFRYGFHKLTYMPYLFLEQPYVPSHVMKLMLATDRGYIDTPFPDLDWAPLKGTAFGFYGSLGMMNFPEPYKKELGPLAKLKDLAEDCGIYGFNPIQAGFHIIGGEPERAASAMLFPLAEAGLDALVGVNAPGAKYLRDEIFYNPFFQYDVAEKAMALAHEDGILLNKGDLFLKYDKKIPFTEVEQKYVDEARKIVGWDSSLISMINMFRIKPDEVDKMEKEFNDLREYLTGISEEDVRKMGWVGENWWDYTSGLTPEEYALLKDLDYFETVVGSKGALLTSSAQREAQTRGEFWMRYSNEITKPKQAELDEVANRYLSGDIRTLKEYIGEVGRVYGEYNNAFNILRKAYPELPITFEEMQIYRDEEGLMPKIDPVSFAKALYFSMEPVDRENILGDKYKDYTTSRRMQDILKENLGPEMWALVQEAIQVNMNPLEAKRVTLDDEYDDMYHRWPDEFFEILPEEDKRIILSAKSPHLTPEEKEEFKNDPVYKAYNSTNREYHRQLRANNPHLNAWGALKEDWNVDSIYPDKELRSDKVKSYRVECAKSIVMQVQDNPELILQFENLKPRVIIDERGWPKAVSMEPIDPNRIVTIDDLERWDEEKTMERTKLLREAAKEREHKEALEEKELAKKEEKKIAEEMWE